MDAIKDYRRRTVLFAESMSNSDLLRAAYESYGDIGDSGSHAYNQMIEIDEEVYKSELEKRLRRIGFLPPLVA